MMAQTSLKMAGLALLALLLSGCTMASVRPAPALASAATAKAAEAAVTEVASTAAPEAASQEAGDQAAIEEDAEALSMVSAFAAPIVPPIAGGPPPSEMDVLIARYATQYAVPERLVRRVIMRESRYNASARNGAYWGLMQISHGTASTMGYRGNASGLLDAETNLRYAVKYLAGAYMVARGNEDQAVRFYASGYYYDAKRQGLLEETGLR